MSNFNVLTIIFRKIVNFEFERFEVIRSKNKFVLNIHELIYFFDKIGFPNFLSFLHPHSHHHHDHFFHSIFYSIIIIWRFVEVERTSEWVWICHKDQKSERFVPFFPWVGLVGVTLHHQTLNMFSFPLFSITQQPKTKTFTYSTAHLSWLLRKESVLLLDSVTFSTFYTLFFFFTLLTFHS